MFFIPIPEICRNPDLLPQLRRDINGQVKSFKDLEKIDPNIGKCQRQIFLQKFI